MPELGGLLRDIGRRPWYYANSAWIRTFRIVSRRGFFRRAVFARTRAGLRDYDSIVFVLGNRMMHIGDQLFFLPLLFKLADAGYPVAVVASPALSFLFPAGLLARKPGNRALYVGRLPVLPDTLRTAGRGVDFFMIDSLSDKIEEPMGLFILRTFHEHFRLTDVALPMTGKDIARLAPRLPLPDALKELAGRPRPIAVLANYMDSGKHLRSSLTADRLLREARQYKAANGGTLLHLGTRGDREQDATDYAGLVDLDLRGVTSIADIFALFGSLEIATVFTFDTAILHIARMYGLPVKAYWRSRPTRERYVQIMRAHIHFFDERVFARDGAEAHTADFRNP